MKLSWVWALLNRGLFRASVHYSTEKFSAEVESWMTGEQYAAWILSARGCDKSTRGWSVSMFTGNTWQDLLGCDFVLDLIGEMEETSNFSSSSRAPTEYPITPERDRSILIPPAPGIQAPAFPPPSLPPELLGVHPVLLCPAVVGACGEHQRCSLGLLRIVSFGILQSIVHFGVLPLGFSGMTQTPVYQPVPSMVGMPAAMPMMPGAGGVAPMPAMVMPQPVVPAVDPSQLAAQQQAFINQQAMLMVSEGPQDLGKSHTLVFMPWRGRTALLLFGPALQEWELCHHCQVFGVGLTSSSPPLYAGEQHIRVKKVRPSKTWTPPAKPQPKEEEKREELEKRKEVKPVPKAEPGKMLCSGDPKVDKEEFSRTPASPLPPPKPKPKMETPKPKKEPPVVKSSGPESRPAPSHEIGNIIKMYQSRPAPEPQPFQPIRTGLSGQSPGMQGTTGSKGFAVLQPSPVPQEKETPPPVKPKPGPASSSIKEKQLPLLSIFKPEGAPPASQAPRAPLLPQPTPEDQAGHVDCKTSLGSCFCSICNTTITLLLQVFYPKENFSHPYCLNLLCEQIIRDTFSESSFRISREEKRKMKDLLIGNNAQSIQEDGIKKRIVVAARDNWANYFSRLFPVQGEKGSDVQILGVSHRGMRLLKVEKAAGYHPEHLKILRSYGFADVLSVEVKGSHSLEFSLKTEQLILHSPKAPCIKTMVELFMQELRQDTNYVVALRSYVVDDKSLLSFKKGDLIELLPMQGVEPGWQFGSTGGRCGLFPTSLVQLAPAPDYLSTSMDRRGEQRKSMKASPESRNTSREVSSPWGGAPRGHGWVLWELPGWVHGSGSV
uniref:SH3 domain-containing protein n=1 Tax=Cyanistes caeruleus TaxID=156563 RepID=A0A8C0UXR7_CYACU